MLAKIIVWSCVSFLLPENCHYMNIARFLTRHSENLRKGMIESVFHSEREI